MNHANSQNQLRVRPTISIAACFAVRWNLLEAAMPLTKTSWQAGRIGNPRGRPKSGEELSAVLRQTVDRRRFAKKLCELCYAGDVQAMRLLLSYTDGWPIGRGEIQTMEGIQITVTYVQQNNQLEFTGSASGAN